MVTAKITAKKGYRCAPDGHTVRMFHFGEVVTGQIAEWAISERAASRMFDPREEKKIVTPPETKTRRKRAKK